MADDRQEQQNAILRAIGGTIQDAVKAANAQSGVPLTFAFFLVTQDGGIGCVSGLDAEELRGMLRIFLANHDEPVSWQR